VHKFINALPARFAEILTILGPKSLEEAIGCRSQPKDELSSMHAKIN